jgi:hypothetical protein
MFRIRNFGNDMECADIAELQRHITRYAGFSISVVDKRPGGRIHFFDVSVSGVISESYGSDRTVELGELLGRPPLLQSP